MLIVFLCLQALSISLSQAGTPHIFSEEHFLDIMATPADRTVAQRSGILVLIQPQCQQELTLPHLNLDQHLYYLIHDYVQTREHTWIEYRDQDDLFRKYAKPNAPCLSAYYFKKGHSLEEPTDIWDDKTDLKMWVWSKVQRRVTIINQYHKRVTIMHYPEGQGPEVAANSIEAGTTKYVTTYMSYSLRIVGEGDNRLLYATVVGDNQAAITVREDKVVDEESSLRTQEVEALDYWIELMGEHFTRHASMIKEPLIVHNYTTVGYDKRTMPSDAYKLMIEFYHQNKVDKTTESIERGQKAYQACSIKDKQPSMILLPRDFDDQMAFIMRPHLEEWCKCKLQFSALYGIREYYEGNVLFNHIDTLNTHVISVIFQIHQELDGAEDWMLEVVDYEGKRKYVKLLPGEMLLYESAKLIHGRPEAFKGKSFANAFMHFKPVEGWDYHFEERHIISKSRNINESIDDPFTELTARRQMFKKKDEL